MSEAVKMTKRDLLDLLAFVKDTDEIEFRSESGLTWTLRNIAQKDIQNSENKKCVLYIK